MSRRLPPSTNSITMKYWPVLRVLVDREDRDDVRVPDASCRACLRASNRSIFCLSIVHLLRSTLIATTCAGPRVVAAIDPAEAAGRDLVEDAVAAQEVPVDVALEELVALPEDEVALPLHAAGSCLGRGLLVVQFDEALADLILADQTQLESELPNSGSVEIDSHIRKRG